MDILFEVKTALDNLERVVMATTIESSGSTPLPAGAALMVKPVGDIVAGTVGGGLLEAQVIEQAKALIEKRGASLIRRFELSDTGSEEGMICGGNIEILFEVIEDTDRLIYTTLQRSREEGRDCVLLRVLDGQQHVVERFVLESVIAEVAQSDPVNSILASRNISTTAFSKALERSYRQEIPAKLAGGSGEIILQPISGLQSLIIFGGGHIGRAVSRIAATAGFRVTVVDDREEYANAQRFPDADRIIPMPIGAAFDHLAIKESTSIVIVTRGHIFDGDALARAVLTPARYVGMIGSNRKVIAAYERLLEQGIPLDTLKRVHAPIGLDIGAVTAEEIAVSIVAELIRVRRGMGESASPLSVRLAKWFENTSASRRKNPT